MLVRTTLLILLITLHLYAVDFGREGRCFPVLEKNLISALEKRLGCGNRKLDGVLSEVGERWIADLGREFRPVVGLTKATSSRSWTYDPVYIVDIDLTNERGEVLVAKGTSLSPLDGRQIDGPLLLFDGSDPEQLEWAEGYAGDRWVLVEGDPFQLGEERDRLIFFDQGGVICHALGIKSVPARVWQEGAVLKVKEISLEENDV